VYNDGKQPKGEGRPLNPEISIILPVYNEEESLVPLFDVLGEVLSEMGKPFEILIIDDGSTDGSPAVMERLRNEYPQVRVIRHRANYGLSAAMETGFRNARGRILATMDADLQNDPRDLPLLLSKLEGADAVVGWRHERQDPLVKRLSSRTANWIRNRAIGDGIHDTGCSLKVFRRDAIGKVKMFKGMHRFLPALLQMEGYRVLEVKVRHHPRRYGEAKYHLANRLLGPFFDLFAVRWMGKRLVVVESDEIGEGEGSADGALSPQP
jgi:dolichol-phosphate mannosyltransferase